MKRIYTIFLFPVLLILLFCMNGCGSKRNTSQESPSQSTSTVSASTSTSIPASTSKVFSYEKMDETYTEDGINAKYPQLIKASDNQKADSINKAIQRDIRTYLDALKAESQDAGKLTLDLNYEISGYKDKVLSITYTGLSSTKGAVYPVNVYHTCNIDIDSTDFVTLKGLFKIDSAFVKGFLAGMYSPYTNDLDLEKSGVDIKEAITGEYANEDLINLFSGDSANYKLTDQGVILSVEVPHAIGDHLEMAVNYESIEGNMIRGNSIWKDYPFLSATSGNTSGNSFTYDSYANARFGFQLSYPDIYTKKEESDNGDGISMESADGNKTLKIWGSLNIDHSTGKTLLDDAKERVSEISSETCDDNFYSIDYEGGDAHPILFHECGYISGGTVVGYVISYPEEEKNRFAGVIEHMTGELKTMKITHQVIKKDNKP